MFSINQCQTDLYHINLNTWSILLILYALNPENNPENIWLVPRHRPVFLDSTNDSPFPRFSILLKVS